MLGSIQTMSFLLYSSLLRAGRRAARILDMTQAP